jgi:hypothetical protein
MKTKLLATLCVILIGLGSITPASATDGDHGGAIIADVVIARPLGLAATVLGTAFFILALPVALPSKSVNKAADALVVTPAKATFTRPLGDFESLKY